MFFQLGLNLGAVFLVGVGGGGGGRKGEMEKDGMLYVVKGGVISLGVILEEVAGDGCVFDDIRGCMCSSRSMSVDHDDES